MVYQAVRLYELVIRCQFADQSLPQRIFPSFLQNSARYCWPANPQKGHQRKSVQAPLALLRKGCFDTDIVDYLRWCVHGRAVKHVSCCYHMSQVWRAPTWWNLRCARPTARQGIEACV